MEFHCTLLLNIIHHKFKLVIIIMFVTLHKFIYHCHNLVIMIMLYQFHNSHSVHSYLFNQ